MSEKNPEMIIYQTEDGTTKIDVYFQGDNAWLSKAQMAELFRRDRSVISRHVRNVFDEGELDEKSNVQKMHIVNSDKSVEYYSLDVIAPECVAINIMDTKIPDNAGTIPEAIPIVPCAY